MNKYKIYHQQLVNARIKLAETKDEEEEEKSSGGIINKIQTGADIVSGVLSFIPGLNVIGSGIDAASAAIDTAQGEYGDAALRAGSATIGLIPGGGAAVKGGVAVAKTAKAVDTAADIGKGVSATAKAAKAADVVSDTTKAARTTDVISDSSKTINTTTKPSLTNRIFNTVKNTAKRSLQGVLKNNAEGSDSESDEKRYVSKMLNLDDPTNVNYRKDLQLNVGRSNEFSMLQPSSYTMSTNRLKRPGTE
jgi:hypothetical protein